MSRRRQDWSEDAARQLTAAREAAIARVRAYVNKFAHLAAHNKKCGRASKLARAAGVARGSLQYVNAADWNPRPETLTRLVNAVVELERQERTARQESQCGSKVVA